jgi:hypothetical protein
LKNLGFVAVVTGFERKTNDWFRQCPLIVARLYDTMGSVYQFTDWPTS